MRTREMNSRSFLLCLFTICVDAFTSGAFSISETVNHGLAMVNAIRRIFFGFAPNKTTICVHLTRPH